MTKIIIKITIKRHPSNWRGREMCSIQLNESAYQATLLKCRCVHFARCLGFPTQHTVAEWMRVNNIESCNDFRHIIELNAFQAIAGSRSTQNSGVNSTTSLAGQLSLSLALALCVSHLGWVALYEQWPKVNAHKYIIANNLVVGANALPASCCCDRSHFNCLLLIVVRYCKIHRLRLERPASNLKRKKQKRSKRPTNQQKKITK